MERIIEPAERARQALPRARARSRGERARPVRCCSTASTWCRKRSRRGVPIEVVAFAERALADAHSPIGALAHDLAARGGRVVAVTDQVLAAISPVDHPSGIVAIARAQPSAMEAAFSAMRGTNAVPSRSDANPLVLMLDGVQDPGQRRRDRARRRGRAARPAWSRWTDRRIRSAGRRCAARWAARSGCRSRPAARCADVIASRRPTRRRGSSPPCRAAARRCRASIFRAPDRDPPRRRRRRACRPAIDGRRDELVTHPDATRRSSR